MSADKTIIITVILYITLFIMMSVAFLNTKFTGNDAAGNGLAKGLTFFYGLGLLFIIAVIVTIINVFFLKNVTSQWIKFFFFVPILLPLLVFGVEYLEIGKSRPPSIEDQAHRLTIEIRTTKELKNALLSFRSSKGGASSKLKDKKIENSFYIYQDNKAIFYESGRKFYIRTDEFETPEYHFEIPYEPKISSFTNWKTLFEEKNDSQQNIKLEFRYKITK